MDELSAHVAAFDALPKELRRAVAYAARTWDAEVIGAQYRAAIERMGRKAALKWMIESIRSADLSACNWVVPLGYTKPVRRVADARSQRVWRRHGVADG